MTNVVAALGAAVVILAAAIVVAWRRTPEDRGRLREGVRMRTRRPMMVLLTLALAGSALADEASRSRPQGPTPCAVVAQVRLEVIGAAFPTLPAPYVSLQTTGIAKLNCGGPDQEGTTSGSQRVTLTVAEARQMGERLVAWADDPDHTETLMAVKYSTGSGSGGASERPAVQSSGSGTWIRFAYDPVAELGPYQHVSVMDLGNGEGMEVFAVALAAAAPDAPSFRIARYDAKAERWVYCLNYYGCEGTGARERLGLFASFHSSPYAVASR